jgi:hypothetical protein
MDEYVHNPERWERCGIPNCPEWRNGIVCRRHWKQAPKELRDAVLMSKRGTVENRRAVHELVQYFA